MFPFHWSMLCPWQDGWQRRRGTDMSFCANGDVQYPLSLYSSLLGPEPETDVFMLQLSFMYQRGGISTGGLINVVISTDHLSLAWCSRKIGRNEVRSLCLYWLWHLGAVGPIFTRRLAMRHGSRRFKPRANLIRTIRGTFNLLYEPWYQDQSYAAVRSGNSFIHHGCVQQSSYR